MATLRPDKTSPSPGAKDANAPARVNKWAVTRAARRVVSSPVSLYSWISGPPLTELDRKRAALAYAEGAQGRGVLIV